MFIASLSFLLLALPIQANTFECALNQPDLRKMFPIELDQLKKFEGIWSDLAFKQNTASKASRSYLINANAKQIQIQIDSINDDGKQTTSPVKEAMVCKSANGPVLKADGFEMPLLILNQKEARFKIGGKWYPFMRIQETHKNFYPEADGTKAATVIPGNNGIVRVIDMSKSSAPARATAPAPATQPSADDGPDTLPTIPEEELKQGKQ